MASILILSILYVIDIQFYTIFCDNWGIGEGELHLITKSVGGLVALLIINHP